MNIDKRFILELKKTNTRIAELIESMTELSEDQLLELNKQILELHRADKEHTQKLKKEETDLDRKRLELNLEQKKTLTNLTNTTYSLNKNIDLMVGKGLTDIKKISVMSNSIIGDSLRKTNTVKDLISKTASITPRSVVPSKQYSKTIKLQNAVIKKLITAQNVKAGPEEDFIRKHSSGTDKLKLLKSISSRLDYKIGTPDPEGPNKKDDTKDSGFSFKNLALGAVGGGGLLAAGKKLLSKGKFLGAGAKAIAKRLPLIGAVVSIYSLVKRLKSGYEDYHKMKAAGNIAGANGAISYTMAGALGDLVGVVGGFLPPLISIPVMGVSMVLDNMADEMKTQVNSKEFNSKESTKAVNLLAAQEKQQVLQLRPSVNGYWEYKDYNSGMFESEWKELIDQTTNKPLSTSMDSNKIVVDNSKKGHGTYRIDTMTGTYELVYDNGPKMKSVNGNKELPIRTGKEPTPDKPIESYQSSTGLKEATNSDRIEKDLKDNNVQLKKNLKKAGTNKDLISKDDDWLSGLTKSLPKFEMPQTVNDAASNAKDYVVDKAKKFSGIISSEVKAAINSIKDPMIRRQAIRTANAESGFDASIKAKQNGKLKSTAGGLYQFTIGTWRDQVKKHKLGFADADRFDAAKSTIVYSYYQKEVNDSISKSLGRPASETDSYMGNFLGVGGAPRFLKAMARNPNDFAYKYVSSKALNSNASMYYKDAAHTQPKTLQEIYITMQNKLTKGDNVIGQFETGTNRVQKSGPALIHQGEMIIPAKNAHKIRSTMHSNQKISRQVSIDEEDELSEDFWINTFMVSLANVVKSEYLGADNE